MKELHLKCTLCRLLPKDHSPKVCRWSTCGCACILKLKKDDGLNMLPSDSPEWLDIQGKELKQVKIPKIYNDYLSVLWHVSRGKEFHRKDAAVFLKQRNEYRRKSFRAV